MSDAESSDEAPELFGPSIVVYDEVIGTLTWEISRHVVENFSPGFQEENLGALHVLTEMYMGFISAVLLGGNNDLANEYLEQFSIYLQNIAQQFVDDLDS